MQTVQLLVRRLSPKAQMPKRATEGSAGYDLYADIPQPITLAVGETAALGTGVAVAVPEGYVGLVFGRSGLGLKYGIVPANAVGVIDSDYRGEIIVGLRNHGQEPYTIEPGDRMAQLVLVPVAVPEPIEVQELTDTQRGSGGFSSTGR